MSAHILHVAYDQSLLKTRALMLEARGYKVTSVLGNQRAMELDAPTLSAFDVVVIGFSSTHSIRTSVLKSLKSRAPGLPVIVLQFNSFENFPAADCVTVCEDPAVWLDAVALFTNSH